MPSAVQSDEVVQLQADINVIIKRRNALSNEMVPRFSRVLDRLAIVKQNPVSAFTSAPTARVSRRGCMLAKKGTFLSDTNSDL